MCVTHSGSRTPAVLGLKLTVSVTVTHPLQTDRLPQTHQTPEIKLALSPGVGGGLQGQVGVFRDLWT